jgi:predicted DCC family thiol-disulfide oxidoreductase YuxK
MDPGGPVLFYDGVCGLCNHTVQFILRHDRKALFRFAPLQSAYAVEVLGRHGRDPRDLDTMYLLLDAGTPRERLLSRSDGILAAMDGLGGVWRVLALGRVLPRSWRDRGYGFVARHRYRWFGRYDSCPLPSPEVQARFLGEGEHVERDETAA